MAVHSRDHIHDRHSDAGALIRQLQALQIAFDTSERKVYEQALEASERRYRDLFDNVLTGVYRTTPDGVVTLANPALQKMLGYRATEQTVIRRLDSSAYQAALVANGSVRALENVWIRKDGSQINVRETSRAVKDTSGATVLYEGIVDDITAEKRNEMFDRGCRRILEMVARNEPLDDILNQIAVLLEAQMPGRMCAVASYRDGRGCPAANLAVDRAFLRIRNPCTGRLRVRRPRCAVSSDDHRTQHRGVGCFFPSSTADGRTGCEGGVEHTHMLARPGARHDQHIRFRTDRSRRPRDRRFGDDQPARRGRG